LEVVEEGVPIWVEVEALEVYYRAVLRSVLISILYL